MTNSFSYECWSSWSGASDCFLRLKDILKKWRIPIYATFVQLDIPPWDVLVASVIGSLLVGWPDPEDFLFSLDSCRRFNIAVLIKWLLEPPILFSSSFEKSSFGKYIWNFTGITFFRITDEPPVLILFVRQNHSHILSKM
jgi:hypothetical protein